MAPRRYRTILYWRPLVPGLNDTDEHLDRAYELSQHADATVFTGLFYRDEIAAYYQRERSARALRHDARRKIMPETLERRVLSAFADSASLFRKTSCAVSYAHGLPDYNGHYGIRELCDICPLSQLDRCKSAHRVPTREQIHADRPCRCLRPAGWQVEDITRGRPWCLAWQRSSRVITCNTRSASRSTMCDGRTMKADMAGPISDGRTQAAMADWTSSTTSSWTSRATASSHPTWLSWPPCRSSAG